MRDSLNDSLGDTTGETRVPSWTRARWLPAFGLRLGPLFRTPWTNLALFAATIASTLWVGAENVSEHGRWWRGWVFALPLLAILVTHEFGHYLQARRHRVEASLPYFLPFPFSAIGTFGAIIAMRGRIRTRNALLDIGASGPLAGMVVAVPVLLYGLKLSTVIPISEHGFDEGNSIFYLACKRAIVGPIPAGHDVLLHPTAFAGWVGLFMTMMNLLPIGQLDGGHVAYALFGPQQDTFSRYVHRGLLAMAVACGAWAVLHAVRSHSSVDMVGIIWLVWWGMLKVMTRFGGPRHPETDATPLSPGRAVVAWGTLALFVLLFMPIPFSVH